MCIVVDDAGQHYKSTVNPNGGCIEGGATPSTVQYVQVAAPSGNTLGYSFAGFTFTVRHYLDPYVLALEADAQARYGYPGSPGLALILTGLALGTLACAGIWCASRCSSGKRANVHAAFPPGPLGLIVRETLSAAESSSFGGCAVIARSVANGSAAEALQRSRVLPVPCGIVAVNGADVSNAPIADVVAALREAATSGRATRLSVAPPASTAAAIAAEAEGAGAEGPAGTANPMASLPRAQHSGDRAGSVAVPSVFATVTHVTPGSPAALGGLRVSDGVVSLFGARRLSYVASCIALAEQYPRSAPRTEVLRGGALVTLRLVPRSGPGWEGKLGALLEEEVEEEEEK